MFVQVLPYVSVSAGSFLPWLNQLDDMLRHFIDISRDSRCDHAFTSNFSHVSGRYFIKLFARMVRSSSPIPASSVHILDLNRLHGTLSSLNIPAFLKEVVTEAF